MTLELDEPDLHAIDEHGQRLYVLGDEALARFGDDPEPKLGGRPVGVGRLLAQFAAIASQTPGMRVAVGAPREAEQPLILYHVVRYEGAWRRVLAEGQTCFECGWTGMTANVRDLALYEGTVEPMTHLRAAMQTEVLPCPSCGTALTRPALWVHTVSPGRVLA